MENLNSRINVTYVDGFINGSPGVLVIDSHGTYRGFIFDKSPYKVVLPGGQYENIYEETTVNKAKALIKRSELAGEDIPFADQFVLSTI